MLQYSMCPRSCQKLSYEESELRQESPKKLVVRTEKVGVCMIKTREAIRYAIGVAIRRCQHPMPTTPNKNNQKRMWLSIELLFL